MPKNRKRVKQKGAKSEAILTKNKIYGRRSSKGTGTMTNPELTAALAKCRKKDKNKLRRAFEARGLAVLPS